MPDICFTYIKMTTTLNIDGLTQFASTVALSGFPITSTAPTNGDLLAFDSASGQFVFRQSSGDIFPLHRISDSGTSEQVLAYNPAAGMAADVNFLAGPQTTEGAATKLFFITNPLDPGTGSIRGGTVTGTQWNSANRGPQSVAFGLDTTASGSHSVVSGGQTNIASGLNSVVPGGSNNSATGSHAIAMGRNATAAGDDMFVWCDGTALSSNVANSVHFACKAGANFYTNAAHSTGVSLPPGGNAWAAVSDVNLKENLKAVDYETAIEKLKLLEIYEYNFKGADPSVISTGPTAQDWHSLFPSGKDPLKIDTMDIVGIAISAIKGLTKKVDDLERRIARMGDL